jgi:hypothetical protein
MRPDRGLEHPSTVFYFIYLDEIYPLFLSMRVAISGDDVRAEPSCARVQQQQQQASVVRVINNVKHM